MNQSSPPLATIEQSLVNHIDALHEKLVAAAAEASKNQSPDQCVAMIAHCSHTIEAFIGLQPTARLFSAAGLPRFGERLMVLITEMQNGSLSWSAALVSAMKNQPAHSAAAPAAAGPSAAEIAQQAQQERFRIAREAQQAQFAAWQKMHDDQQRMFDEQNKRWSEAFNKR